MVKTWSLLLICILTFPSLQQPLILLHYSSGLGISFAASLPHSLSLTTALSLPYLNANLLIILLLPVLDQCLHYGSLVIGGHRVPKHQPLLHLPPLIHLRRLQRSLSCSWDLSASWRFRQLVGGFCLCWQSSRLAFPPRCFHRGG